MPSRPSSTAYPRRRGSPGRYMNEGPGRSADQAAERRLDERFTLEKTTMSPPFLRLRQIENDVLGRLIEGPVPLPRRTRERAREHDLLGVARPRSVATVLRVGVRLISAEAAPVAVEPSAFGAADSAVVAGCQSPVEIVARAQRRLMRVRHHRSHVFKNRPGRRWRPSMLRMMSRTARRPFVLVAASSLVIVFAATVAASCRGTASRPSWIPR